MGFIVVLLSPGLHKEVRRLVHEGRGPVRAPVGRGITAHDPDPASAERDQRRGEREKRRENVDRKDFRPSGRNMSAVSTRSLF